MPLVPVQSQGPFGHGDRRVALAQPVGIGAQVEQRDRQHEHVVLLEEHPHGLGQRGPLGVRPRHVGAGEGGAGPDVLGERGLEGARVRGQQRAVTAADLDHRARAELRLGAQRPHVRGLRSRPERAPAAEALRLGRVGLRIARLVEGAGIVQGGARQETAEKPSPTFAQLTVFHQASR